MLAEKNSASKANFKRILFLTSSAPKFPGDSTAPFILNMARDLRDLGWEVDILAPHATGLREKEEIDGVTIHRFRYMWPARWQKLCYGGGAAINLRRNRLNVLAVPMFAAAAFLAAAALVMRSRPAVIHSHWVIPQGVIGQLLASAMGVPHIISVHGADIFGFRGQPWRAIKAWALRACSHVIANSTSTRAEVEALGRSNALSVIPTGAAKPAAQSSSLRRETFAGAHEKIAVFVGRLIEEKGARFLIEALPLILTHEHVKLLIVGDGPQRAELEKFAQDLGVGSNIVFVGAVPQPRVYDYLALADVFVGPSIEIPGEWTEAQGNTFVEALLARVPVVASRIGGIPDAIIHERTGLLIDQRAPEQIAQAVLRILSDDELASRLRDAGYQHAIRNFSRFASAQKLDSIYKNVLERLA